MLVYPGLGNGQFGPALNGGHGFFAGTNPTGITVANLNGQPDLIVANSGSNDVSILLNQKTADGGFTFVPGPRLNLKTAKQQGIGPVATAIVPSPSGGPSSLAVSLSGSNQVWLIPGVGGGFFNDQNPTIFSVGNQPGPLSSSATSTASPTWSTVNFRVEQRDRDLRPHGLGSGHHGPSPPAASARWRPSNSAPPAAALTTWSWPTMVTASLRCWKGGPMA